MKTLKAYYESLFDVEKELDIYVGMEIGGIFVVDYIGKDYITLSSKEKLNHHVPIYISQETIYDLEVVMERASVNTIKLNHNICLGMDSKEFDLRGLHLNIGNFNCKVDATRALVLKNGSLSAGTFTFINRFGKAEFSNIHIYADGWFDCSGIFPALDNKSTIKTYSITVHIKKKTKNSFGQIEDVKYWVFTDPKDIINKLELNNPNIDYKALKLILPQGDYVSKNKGKTFTDHKGRVFAEMNKQ